MPDSFLTRFRTIHAIDIDHLAPVLFRALHGRALRRAGTSLHWSQTDFLSDPPKVLASIKKPAVLFCNIMGQLRFQLRDEALVEAEVLRVKALLAGYDWASFHELLSGDQPPSRSPYAPQALGGRPEGVDILAHYGLGGVWLDHLTGALLPETSARMILPWRFGPRRLHLVEAGFVAREA